MRVAKYLFDYDDITLLIHKAKDLMPFLTFTRKNIPVQLQHLVQEPAVLSRWVKAKDAFEGDNEPGDVDFPDLPEFIRENVPITARKLDDGTYEYFLLGNWIAFTEVEKLFSPGESIMNMLYPGVKLPFELMLNRSMFFKTDIDRGIAAERKKFLGMPIDPKVAHALKAVRFLNETDRLLGLGAEDMLVKESTGQQLLRAATGLRFLPVDPEQEKLRRYKKHADAMGKRLALERYKLQQ